MSTAAVIGLGRIGAGYDLLGSVLPRSHVGALLASNFNVTAVVDPMRAAWDGILQAWPQLTGCAYFPSIDYLTDPVADVIVLATPPDHRLEQIEALLRLRPKVLVVEKPLAWDSATALRIATAVAATDVEVRINFHRRFDSGHVAVRARLNGRPAKVVMSYGKGLFNYASHLVDLAVDWFGDIASVQAFGEPSADNPSFCCRMAAGFELLVVGIDGLGYDQFDVDVFLPDEKLAIHLGGCDRSMQTPVNGRFYPGYVHLGTPVALGQAGPIGGMLELYRDIRSYLETGARLAGCTVEAAAHGVAVLEAVDMSRQSGHPVTLIGRT